MRSAKGNSFLAWLGGKSMLADQIVALAPPHTCYCEVFAGAAWVLFRKPESKVEVINDMNLDLVTLYRVVKHHLEELIRQFRWVLYHRDEFDRLFKVDPGTLTDVQRAARFFYLMRAGFAGQVGSRSFSTSTYQRPRLNLMRLEEDLSEAHLRLARVHVERLPFDACIDRYDKPHTWFYLDPPYYGSEDDYGKGMFQRADFDRLAALLARVKGRFLLSLNDTPEVRRAFSRFDVREVRTRYSASGGGRSPTAAKGRPVRELLFLNYRPPRDT